MNKEYKDNKNVGRYYEAEGGIINIVHYPDEIEIYGMGPCIGIGILNKKSRTGYVGHFIPQDKINVKLVVDRALAEAEQVSDLEIALAGNQIGTKGEWEGYSDIAESCGFSRFSYESHVKVHKKYEQFLKKMLKSLGFKKKQISIHFETLPGLGSYNIIVDTAKGKIEVGYTDCYEEAELREKDQIAIKKLKKQ